MATTNAVVLILLLAAVSGIASGGRDIVDDIIRLPSEAARFFKKTDADDDVSGTRWAVLIAGSNGYWNYRHQADICHAYQLLKKGGLKDENIIVFMYDDIAGNVENPRPGVIINSPHGVDVYNGVPKDYTGEHVTVDNFFAVILGNRSALKGGSGKVVDSGPNDHIFIYYSDHGGPGVLGMPTYPYIYAGDLIDVLKQKHASGTYKSLVFYIEACESGSIFEGLLPDGLNIYATTASNAEESSWGTYCPGEYPSPPLEYDTCLGDLYSVAWMEDSDVHNLRTETLHQQYELVKKRTANSNYGYGSHVMQYGDIELSKNSLFEYMGTNPANDNSTFVDGNRLMMPSKAVNQRDADLLHFWNQLQSGAKIQVTRDTEADPHSVTRPVELMGTPEQISKAEQLIREVLAEAEQGGSGVVSRRLTGQAGSEQFVMKIPDNKVGLVIGKGGETIKNMQASSGARIQVIPLRKPPGDMSTERTVQIDGTSEQIEAAKQLVNEVISGENRLRNPTMAGGYSQQGYQARPPTSWGPGAPQMQQPGYGYVQPGSYPGPSPQYNMGNPSYPYSQPTSGGYSANWDQSTAPPTQQPSQGSGYDYYNQQAPTQQQTPGGSAQAGDNAGYNYSQPPATGYGQQGQGYAQDGYGGYQAPPPNSGYGQPPYDQHQTYNSATGYGNAANPSQEVQTSTYGTQGDSSQAPPAGQPPVGQGYTATQQPSPNPASYPQGYGATPAAQAGYGNLPSAQSGYGPGYGMPQTQKSAYGQQPQQSPSNGSGYPQPSMQPGYPHSQPAAPSAYAQADSGAQHAPPSGYGAAQPGYGQPPYGATPVAQPGYGQAPPPYGSYGSGYSQTPQVYAAADANAGGSTPASQTNQQGGVAKASPQS